MSKSRRRTFRAKLAEIDENLLRLELTVLERGEHLARRKELYLALHPEPKPVREQGGPGRGKKKTSEIISPVSFTEDTAEATRQSKRSVEQEVQIATSIAPDVKAEIADTPVADDKTALLALARLSEEEQRRVVDEAGADPKAIKREAADPKRASSSRRVAALQIPLAHTATRRVGVPSAVGVDTGVSEGAGDAVGVGVLVGAGSEVGAGPHPSGLDTLQVCVSNDFGKPLASKPPMSVTSQDAGRVCEQGERGHAHELKIVADECEWRPGCVGELPRFAVPEPYLAGQDGSFAVKNLDSAC